MSALTYRTRPGADLGRSGAAVFRPHVNATILGINMEWGQTRSSRAGDRHGVSVPTIAQRSGAGLARPEQVAGPGGLTGERAMGTGTQFMEW